MEATIINLQRVKQRASTLRSVLGSLKKTTKDEKIGNKLQSAINKANEIGRIANGILKCWEKGKKTGISSSG